MTTAPTLLVAAPTLLVVALAVAVVAVVALTAAVVYLLRQNRALRRRLVSPPVWAAIPSQPSPSPAPPLPTNQPLDTAALFEALNRRVNEERLFLDPDFGREGLCAVSGLQKERIGELIRLYGGGGNVQTYLNRKRVAYAVTLMQEHPNYSMEAIAVECGIGNISTFYRVFKQAYGASPNEYRKKLG